ncbi:hypothetical protein [Gillisia sp. CAL575]|uniref:hypothetical protein n=1 Tax=Gillisia sp. CAL575 TaxID=985255 RepID=UPI0003A51018|nr:hypothetical protein [Gillisia sp. CAL575]
MKKEQNCPNCDGRIYLTYNKSDLKRKFLFENTKIAEFKTTNIYRCSVCATAWYDHQDFDSLYSVEKDGLNKLLEWSSKKHELNTSIFTFLKEIGATPANFYGDKNQIEFPCKCVLNNDEEIDFCLIRFQNLPPFLNSTDYEKVFSVNDIKYIQRSNFALNKIIRKKSANAKELRNGFAPTAVKDPNDNYFVLNWTKNFFNMNGIVGSCLEYAEKHPHEKDMIYEDSKLYITYIIGDWNEELLKLSIT